MKGLRVTGSFSLLAVVLVVGAVAPVAGAQVNVLTWHNDNWRTGQNTQENTLTTALVGDKTKFGRGAHLW